ncbi:OmpA-OmpF porin, OOP family [Azospirillaceae bacterium]
MHIGKKLLLTCIAGVALAAFSMRAAQAEEGQVLGNDASECQIAASLGVAKPGCPPLHKKKPGTRGLAIGNIDQMPSSPPPNYAPTAVPEASAATSAPAAESSSRPSNARPNKPQRPAQHQAAPPAQEEYKAAFKINFEFGSSNLTEESKQLLDNIANVLSSSANRFKIAGHTDSVGNPSSNLSLSAARAQAVKDYLTNNHQIDSSRLQTVGMGSKSPLNRADPSAGENRRVELINLGG